MQQVKVIIPLYTDRLTEHEWLSLRHNIAMLERYPVVLVFPEGVDAGAFTTEFPQCEVLRVSDQWLGAKNGIAGYNRMMLSEEFYALFTDCEYIFICQTDAWIFRDELTAWCDKGYDYIGGVWWRKGVWSMPLLRYLFPRNRRLYGKVGNGGLSLRRVESFRRVCRERQDRIAYYLQQKHHIYAEDVFWAIEPRNFHYPPMREAVFFAFDCRPDRCMQVTDYRLPFGCHGWSKPDRLDFWERYILKAPKRYLFFVILPYAYSILRQLELEIRRQGDVAAWYIERGCPALLEAGEQQLKTVREVIDYDPVAVFTAGNYIYDFFPGVKVEVFHGYAIKKRNRPQDEHFRIRGWFDIYCTQGPSSTQKFRELELQIKHFRVYETGWPKADMYFSAGLPALPCNERPRILYSTTFSHTLTSAPYVADEIERLAATRAWDWVFMFHPKVTNPAILERYRQIANKYENVTFLGSTFDFNAMRDADVMLCDSSSVIVEFMFLDKPVVTYRNSHPGEHLINIQEPTQLEGALEKAISRPADLMKRLHDYSMFHEPHRDGRCSERVLAAVDDFLIRGHVGLKPKPVNLIRKWRVRCKALYFPIFEWFRR